MKLLALLTALTIGTAALQDEDQPAQPLDEHGWLQQLVGEWNVTGEGDMGPGAEPVKMESTEKARSIGGLWILSELSADFGGAPFTAIMSLGYDTNQGVFVGTWFDTMQTHLWTYRGTLDAARKVLTLETEGPSFGDPSKTAKYRDAIEIKGPGHKVLTSSMQGEDGEWTTFMRADYRRKE